MALQDIPEDKPIAVPAYSSSGIFGEDVNDVRQQIAMQQQNNAMQFANMPRGRGPVYAAALAGQQLGGAVAGAVGWVDPRIDRAQKLQDAAKEVDSQGLSLMTDPDSYYKAAYASLTKRGLYQEAAKVADIMQQQELAVYKAQTDRLKASKGYVQNGQGQVINKDTGEVVKEGNPFAGKNGAVITLAPKGTKFKGGPDQLSFNTQDPAQLADVNERMASGQWVDAKTLPSPPHPLVALDLNDRRGLNSQQFVQDLVSPAVKTVISAASGAEDAKNYAESLKTLLVKGQAPTGAFANFLAGTGRYLEKLGVPESILDALKINPSDAEAINAAHSYLVAAIARSSAGGNQRVTNQMLQLAEKSGAELWNTPQGQYLLADWISKRADYDYQNAKDTSEIFKEKENYDNPMVGYGKMVDTLHGRSFQLTPDSLDNIKAAYQYLTEAYKLPSVKQTFNPKAKNGGFDPNKIYNYNGRKVRILGLETLPTGKQIPYAIPIEDKEGIAKREAEISGR